MSISKYNNSSKTELLLIDLLQTGGIIVKEEEIQRAQPKISIIAEKQKLQDDYIKEQDDIKKKIQSKQRHKSRIRRRKKKIVKPLHLIDPKVGKSTLKVKKKEKMNNTSSTHPHIEFHKKRQQQDKKVLTWYNLKNK